MSGTAPPRRRVLLVEDEPSLVMTLTDRLVSEGYEVEPAGDGETALTLSDTRSFDIVLLDVMLPGRDGFEVCRELRQRGAQVPILMLTARTQTIDKVVGLKLGADDYLTKPFDVMELLARMEALLRRARTPIAGSVGTYAFGDVTVDFRSASVTRDGQPVPLSALEYKLLTHLIEHRGALVSREELLDRVWGYSRNLMTRTVDVHVASLRQKIEINPARPRYILTVHRLGYRFAG